jgi:hypothetical protein
MSQAAVIDLVKEKERNVIITISFLLIDHVSEFKRRRSIVN